MKYPCKEKNLVNELTVDSSVIISSLLKTERRHKEALKIWESILQGQAFAIMPYKILVETVAALRRRTGSEELALEVKKELLSIKNNSFVIFNDKSASKAAKIASKTVLRGMYANRSLSCKGTCTELVTFDEEMMKKAKSILKKK